MLKELNEVIRAWKGISRSTDDGSEQALVRRCMLENVSYRLPGNSEGDKLLGFRVLYRTLRVTWKGQSPIKSYSGGGSSAVLEGLFQYETLEKEYVEKQAQLSLGHFISKQHLSGACRSISYKLFGSIRLVFFALPIALRVQKATNRTNLALLINQIPEVAGLLYLCRQHKIQSLYDFIPFEIDGNFISFILKNEGVKVVKLPSPGPLKTHNHILLGDELVLSSQYQFDEIKELPNIKIQKLLKWVPEYAFTYIDRYHEGQFTPESKTIGFYSHGGWLRQDEGHADDGLNIPEAEEHLLTDLGSFITKHPDYQLKIYPHPKEKTEEWMQKTLEFYQSRFGEGIDIAGKEVRTSGSFEQVDIAVAAFSTILYERMFCGFKTLIGNYGFESFPMELSSLRNICFHDGDKLEQLIMKASEMDKDTFFDTHYLGGYRYFEYPYFKNE